MDKTFLIMSQNPNNMLLFFHLRKDILTIDCHKREVVLHVQESNSKFNFSRFVSNWDQLWNKGA
jgi:phage-related protein